MDTIMNIPGELEYLKRLVKLVLKKRNETM